MKTLILLIIGTLFGIWFYNHHSNLIPRGVTDNIDKAVDWAKDLWPDKQSNPPSYKETTARRTTPSGTPSVTADPSADSEFSESPQTQTTNRRRSIPEEPPTPRSAAMESYTRTTRMIDASN